MMECEPKLKYREVIGGSFTCHKMALIMHCINEDFQLGKRVAVLIKKYFPELKKIAKICKKVGDLAAMRDGNTFIYNLITKAKARGKPRYSNLERCLMAL